MLAYVFWHAPTATDATETYEEALRDFHRSLAQAALAGLRGSGAWRVEGAAWVPSPVVYEDWYLIDDFAALGELNAAAASGGRERSHAVVAALAGFGAAGLYALRNGALRPPPVGTAAWFDKPSGAPGDGFVAGLGGRCSVWQRQLVLGPTPEFCSLDDDDPPAGAVLVTRREIALHDA